ncbi:hypothetical protein [Moorena sp. SIO3I6]|uniref:hypothetical protein n=1 Tax=Moorena sp. SIO3I6 TaxID=2607831 RepID=UPI0013F9E88B|nr:hypothetical protein [Moorena sp. SIO3I6]NEP26036.1 hypothetical protein [Moorena sp. SIO3I6]
MNIENAIAGILAAQAPSGAFLSTVYLPDGPVPDENGFVTALVLHELTHLPQTPAVMAAQERALDFLARCELPTQPGAFSFYPPDGHPSWMPIPLNPDADDSALFAFALVRAGRKPKAFLEQVVREVLAKFRLFWISGTAKPWYQSGVYFTWLNKLYYPNIIDVCVNVNIAVLLKAAGVGEALGITNIVQMVELGVAWAGTSSERALLLSPYYPHPMELLYAVERAVELGVEDFIACRETLRKLPWAQSDSCEGWSENRPICSSEDGRILWRSAVLQQARRLSAMLVV